MSATVTVVTETAPAWTPTAIPFEGNSTELESIKDGGKDVIAMDTYHTTPGFTLNDQRQSPETVTEVGSELNESSGGIPVVTSTMRRRETVVMIAMCFVLFLEGWNDGAIGPLLPRIQQWYGIGFTVVSILWVSQCLGFISGALVNVYLADRVSFGKLMAAASLLHVVGYAIQATAPPFPIFCLAATLIGFGASIQDAQANSLVASVHHHSSEKMGLLHAIYGLGCLASPLVSTQFAQMRRWSFHFLVSFGVALINTTSLTLIVGNQTFESLLRSIGSPPLESDHTIINTGRSNNVESASSSRPQLSVTAPKSSMNQIFRLKDVHLMAAFLLVYVGVEVTIGGWIVTYIIDVRGGGASSGYISSGFFGGLALGRIALVWINRMVGEKRVVYLYALLAIGLEFVIWRVVSLIGNAIAVSLVGLVLAPMYPLCMTLAGRVLPRRVRAGGIGWIAGIGQAGSALVPFLTGALSGHFGIKVLQPLLIAMMILMTGLWTLIPNHSKRRD